MKADGEGGWGESGKEGEPAFMEHLLYAGSELGCSHTTHLLGRTGRLGESDSTQTQRPRLTQVCVATCPGSPVCALPGPRPPGGHDPRLLPSTSSCLAVSVTPSYLRPPSRSLLPPGGLARTMVLFFGMFSSSVSVKHCARAGPAPCDTFAVLSMCSRPNAFEIGASYYPRRASV